MRQFCILQVVQFPPEQTQVAFESPAGLGAQPAWQIQTPEFNKNVGLHCKH